MSLNLDSAVATDAADFAVSGLPQPAWRRTHDGWISNDNEFIEDTEIDLIRNRISAAERDPALGYSLEETHSYLESLRENLAKYGRLTR